MTTTKAPGIWLLSALRDKSTVLLIQQPLLEPSLRPCVGCRRISAAQCAWPGSAASPALGLCKKRAPAFRFLPVSAFHHSVLGPGICSMPVSPQVQNWGPATQKPPLDPACTEEARQADREIARTTGLPTQARTMGGICTIMTACTHMDHILGFGLRKSWLASHNPNCLDSIDSISRAANATTVCQSQGRCCHSPDRSSSPSGIT